MFLDFFSKGEYLFCVPWNFTISSPRWFFGVFALPFSSTVNGVTTTVVFVRIHKHFCSGWIWPRKQRHKLPLFFFFSLPLVFPLSAIRSQKWSEEYLLFLGTLIHRKCLPYLNACPLSITTASISHMFLFDSIRKLRTRLLCKQAWKQSCLVWCIHVDANMQGSTHRSFQHQH